MGKNPPKTPHKMTTVERVLSEFTRACYPDGLPTLDDESGQKAALAKEFRGWCERHQSPETLEEMKSEALEKLASEVTEEAHREAVAAGKVRCVGVKFEDGEFVELWQGVKEG